MKKEEDFTLVWSRILFYFYISNTPKGLSKLDI